MTTVIKEIKINELYENVSSIRGSESPRRNSSPEIGNISPRRNNTSSKRTNASSKSTNTSPRRNNTSSKRTNTSSKKANSKKKSNLGGAKINPNVNYTRAQLYEKAQFIKKQLGGGRINLCDKNKDELYQFCNQYQL